MAAWLFKSDPEHYSFPDLVREGRTVWDGVSNNLALKNLRTVRPGDSVLIYHTGGEKCIMGVAEVTSEPYPDPKQKNPRLVVIDVKAGHSLPRPVPLDEIKKEPLLSGFDLVRLPRLSLCLSRTLNGKL
ncbi:MAG: EVE domain-containing protein [Terriglobia bacterium]